MGVFPLTVVLISLIIPSSKGIMFQVLVLNVKKPFNNV